MFDEPVVAPFVVAEEPLLSEPELARDPLAREVSGGAADLDPVKAPVLSGEPEQGLGRPRREALSPVPLPDPVADHRLPVRPVDVGEVGDAGDVPLVLDPGPERMLRFLLWKRAFGEGDEVLPGRHLIGPVGPPPEVAPVFVDQREELVGPGRIEVDEASFPGERSGERRQRNLQVKRCSIILDPAAVERNSGSIKAITDLRDGTSLLRRSNQLVLIVMHLPIFIQDLAVILVTAGLMSIVFTRLKQPVVLGYILAGMLIGPYTPPFQLVTDVEGIRTWAELGVIFLMFTLGLEFSFRKLTRVGATASVAAALEVLFFLPVGYALGRAFGWTTMDAIFLGAMLAISSTTIIIKALDELKLKRSQFAETIFGILIVEDLLAILLIVGLTTLATSESLSGLILAGAALKLVLVVGGWFIAGYLVVPRFIKYVVRVGNNEMMTLVALGFCLFLVVVAAKFHYSAALGAFIMGSIIAESPALHQIETRVEPFRDLFGAIFFVSIGMLIDPAIIWEYKGTIAVLCAVTIGGKIVSTGLGVLVAGQPLRESIRVGFGLAQIGEFSFIIAGLGASLKVTSEFLYPIGVAVSLITTFTTPYLILWSGPVARAAEERLPRLTRLLNRYADWLAARRLVVTSGQGPGTGTLKWLVNALVTALIFILGAEYALPYVQRVPVLDGTPGRLLIWLLLLLASAPFTWAMSNSFGQEEIPGRGFVFSLRGSVARALALCLIVILSADFFPPMIIVAGAVVSFAVLFLFFYRGLKKSYGSLEQHFLASFERAADPAADKLVKLGPWESHLLRLTVHPNAVFVGKTLAEANLRNSYGVNIVAIQRGAETTVAPLPSQQLFPYDELLVLASDEAVTTASAFIAEPRLCAAEEPGIFRYELQRVLVDEYSHLRPGVSIRESGVREQHSSIVVGVERKGVRITNPDSDLKLEAGDVVWIVGTGDALSLLAARGASPDPKDDAAAGAVQPS
jgi:CPA2 family monovalent cation:H+ antiporter-2